MENKKVVRIISFILLLLIVNEVFGETSPWSIKAEKIEFYWETRTFKAYGKVKIEGKGIIIYADSVEGNVNDGIVKASGNVVFKDRKGEFLAKELVYAFKKDEGELLQVKATYTAEGVKGNLYFSGSLLEWKKNEIIINKGAITTCDLENPHYLLYASKITYLPDDKIILDGVSLKFIFLPFSIPLFRYVISLKEEPNPFPQIGFDAQSIFLSYPISYVIFNQAGLISVLLKHNFVTNQNPYSIDITQNYNLRNIKGSIKLNLSEYIDFQSIKSPNVSLNWNHDQKISDFIFFNNNLSYYLKPQYNYFSIQDNLRFTFTYGLNRTSLQFNMSQDVNSQKFGSILNLSQNFDKEGTKSFVFNARYNNNIISGNRRYELYEDGRINFRGKNYSLSIYQNYRVSDPKNLLLLKIPEITFNSNFNLFSVPLRFEGILGYYDEPSSYMKALKLGYSLYLPLSYRVSNLSLNANFGYKQDFYQTGDARYFILGNLQANYKPLSFLNLSTIYNFQLLGKDIITGDLGNTPFYFDYMGETNNLTLSILLGTQDVNLSLSDSYNFINNTLSPLNIRGRLSYRNLFILTGSSNYDWKNQKFSPVILQGTFSLPPTMAFSLGALINPYYDNPLQRLDYKLIFDIKGDWHFAGKLTLWGTYPSANVYPLISLEKDLHCFLGKFSLNPNTGSFQFEISLKAIPTKKIGGELTPTGFSLLPNF